MAEQMIEISLAEYRDLLAKEAMLECLQSCGVDNWVGYGDAQEMMEDSK